MWSECCEGGIVCPYVSYFPASWPTIQLLIELGVGDGHNTLLILVYLVNNKMYTQRRLTQLCIYLALATGVGLPDHLQAFALYNKSIYNW